MRRIHAFALLLFVAGVLVFCFCPGEVGGSGWRYVDGPDGQELVKIEGTPDGWIALGSGLVFAAWAVLMLSSCSDVAPPPAPSESIRKQE